MLSTMYIALGPTDLLVDLVAIDHYGIDTMTLGILSRLWVLLWALASKIALRTAESRASKTLIITILYLCFIYLYIFYLYISMLAVQTFIHFLLVLKGVHHFFIAQALHAVRAALTKNVVSITILGNMNEEVRRLSTEYWRISALSSSLNLLRFSPSYQGFTTTPLMLPPI